MLYLYFRITFNDYGMRKFLLFGFAAFLCSCTQTVEDRISDKFKEYVNSNFDDPSDLKEIVSIEIHDSTNNATMLELFNCACELDTLVAGVDSLKNKKWDKFMKNFGNSVISERSDHLSKYKREQMLSDAIKYLFEQADADNSVQKKIKQIAEHKCLLDSIYYSLDTINVYVYRIRTRITELDKAIKIHDYFATIEDDDIRISDTEPSFIGISVKCDGFTKEYTHYVELYNELVLLSNNRDTLRKKFIDLFVSNGFLLPFDYY